MLNFYYIFSLFFLAVLNNNRKSAVMQISYHLCTGLHYIHIYIHPALIMDCRNKLV